MVATTGIAIELQDKTKQGARSITRSLDDIKKSARETATSVDKLDDNFDKLKDELDKTGRSADKAGEEFDKLARKAKRAGDATGGMGRNFTALKGAFAAVGTSVVIKQFFDLLDVSTQINNRLKLVTDSTYALGLAQQQLFEVSQKSRVGFDQTVDLYSRLARSSKELGLTQKELVDITETISQAITISGASADAASAALLQLGQGIASGTLRGEELNSVLEQTPRLAQAIADGIGVSIGQLRALGAEGALTSETVVKAIQTQQGAVRTEFGQTSATIGQSLTVVNNSLTKLVSEIDKAAGVSNKLATALLGIAGSLDTLSNRPEIATEGILGFLTGGATGSYGRAVRATMTPPPSSSSQNSEAQKLAFELQQTLLSLGSASGRELSYISRLTPPTRPSIAFVPSEPTYEESLQTALDDLGEYFDELSAETDRYFQSELEAYINQAETKRKFDDLMLEGNSRLSESADDRRKVELQLYKQELERQGFNEEQVTALLNLNVKESIRRDALKREAEESALATEAVEALVGSLAKVSPELAVFSNTILDLAKGNYGNVIASTFESLVGAYSALRDTPPAIHELSFALAQLNNEARQAAQASAGVFETLFAEENVQLQNNLMSLFEFLFQRSFDFDPGEGLAESSRAIQDFFLLLQRFDELMSGNLSVAAQPAFLAQAQSFFNFGGMGDVEWNRLIDAEEGRLTSLGKTILGEFEFLVGQFRNVFGDFSFTELGEDMFKTSDSFAALREASDSFRQANEGSIDSLERLTAAEQAATRLRINAQEIALRTQLSQEFRRAGSDVFEQRAAYTRFQQAVRQLQYMGRAGAALTGGGGGAGASTTAATTTATGGGAATTTGATAAGLPPINATVAINAAMITPDQLVRLPSEQDMESYYSAELLPVLSDPVAPILDQFSDNIRANKVRIYPWTLFDVPSSSVWSSYWSRFLLARADTEETGPDSVSAQIVENASANKKYISPFTLFHLPTAGDWSSYWSRFLLGRADTAEHGPDNVAAQILDNTKDNKKRINPEDMFIVPTSSIWSSYWSVFLLGRADTDEHGPDNVAAQILNNAQTNRVRINPTDMFAIASGDQFRSFWQQGLNSIVVTDEYGPGAAIAYTREHTANRKLEIKPSDLFSIPSGFDFFFLFADLAPNITFGLNSVLNNLSTIPVNVASLIDFDASGISEAINAAVKEAISDRSYDAPQRLGFTSGRA